MTTANHPSSSTLPYTIVFAALLALLGVTVALAFVDLGHHLGLTIALFIAGLKALLIVLYFMHVRSEPWRVAMFAAAGFVWLMILVVLIYSDYATRSLPGVNPKGEPRMLRSPVPSPGTPGEG